jgi:hypothetical protein
MLRRTFASFRTDAGTNIIEAALITPLLLGLTFSVVDFGVIFYVHLALQNGVSQATRYGITGNQMEDPENEGEVLSREESIKAAMRDATPTLTLDDDAFTFSHLPAGTETWQGGSGEPGDIIKVRVTYTRPILTPLVRPFFADGVIRLAAESAMKSESRFE